MKTLVLALCFMAVFEGILPLVAPAKWKMCIRDRPKHARELIELVRTVPCKFNLITFNPFPDSDLKRPERETVLAFAKILNDAGIVTTIRKTRGDDIDAVSYTHLDVYKRQILSTMPLFQKEAQ